ncbi:MAG: hypothetical protein KME49_29275 [Brasilonema octagenarum HA4186-MV1]|jgi:hypothetical protein|nr:hypothetical protein [Brasilonema octagenarum HA4186-MV1]
MFHATILEPLEADQWFVDSVDLREFVVTAKEIRDKPLCFKHSLSHHTQSCPNPQ